MNNEYRYATAKRVTLVNALSNILLAVFKITVGYWGHSQALLADGVHSLSDLISDALVLAAAKIGHKVPDADHPYGHLRFETLTAMIIAIILMAVGGSIIYNAYQHMFHARIIFINSGLILLAALISVAIKEWLYRYTLIHAKKIYSDLLLSTAYHHRTDMWISLLVVISALATHFHLNYVDTICAAIIAIIILQSAIQLFIRGLKELIDTGVDKTTSNQIKECIIKTSGVASIHQLRSRSHGGKILIDLHIIVNSFISVSEGHHISEKVQQKLLKNFPKIADITVHIDPENDEINQPSLNLPSREELLLQFKDNSQDLPHFDAIEKLEIHYYNGKIYLEIGWPANFITTDRLQEIEAIYKKMMLKFPYIASIKLWMRI